MARVDIHVGEAVHPMEVRSFPEALQLASAIQNYTNEWIEINGMIHVRASAVTATVVHQ